MNEDDFAILRDFCIRLRQSFVTVKRLANIPPAARLEDVQETLTTFERDLAKFTEQVQQRETVSWGGESPSRIAPRHPENRYIAPAPDSRTFDPHARVRKFDSRGRERSTDGHV